VCPETGAPPIVERIVSGCIMPGYAFSHTLAFMFFIPGIKLEGSDAFEAPVNKEEPEL